MDKLTQILEDVVRSKCFEACVHIKNPIKNSYQDGLGRTTQTLDHVVVVHILIWDKRKSQINKYSDLNAKSFPHYSHDKVCVLFNGDVTRTITSKAFRACDQIDKHNICFFWFTFQMHQVLVQCPHWPLICWHLLQLSPTIWTDFCADRTVNHIKFTPNSKAWR